MVDPKPAERRYQTSLKNLENKFGDKNILQQKTPSNPRYANVKSVTKTGSTMKGCNVVSDQLIAKRKGEKFKRVKCSTLAKLLHEQTEGELESIYDLNRLGNNPDGMDSVSVVAGKQDLGSHHIQAS